MLAGKIFYVTLWHRVFFEKSTGKEVSQIYGIVKFSTMFTGYCHLALYCTC